MTKPKTSKGRPTNERTKDELPHPGVSVISPNPKHGRPHWVIRWSEGEKFVYQVLPFARGRPDAVRAAADKSAALGRSGGTKARTLQDELEAYITAGIKSGKRLGQPYAAPTERNFRKAVRSLTTFAASKGCATRDDKALYLTEIPRTFDDNGRSLLWHWKQHEAKTQGPGAVMALTKCIHALLKAARISDTETMFDPRLLAGAIPVRFVAPANAPRVLTMEELRRILRKAMELDTPEELVSADIALLLVTTLRRAEQSYLRVRHCRVDAVPPGYADVRATWIELPGKLDEERKYNHAKGGKPRNVLMTRVTPLGCELLYALCQGRMPLEWVTSLDYSKLANRVDTISAKTGIEFSTKSLRATAANHCHRVLGKDAAITRCGHTEGVANQSYKDDEFAAALVFDVPPSLEVSMGIEAELREIITRANKHPRAWGSTSRPIPDVLKSGNAAPSTQALPIAV